MVEEGFQLVNEIYQSVSGLIDPFIVVLFP